MLNNDAVYVTEPEAIEITTLPDGTYQVTMRKDITEVTEATDNTSVNEDGEEVTSTTTTTTYTCREAVGSYSAPITAEFINTDFDKYFNIFACSVPDVSVVQKQYSDAVQAKLDEEAQKCGYDNVFTICTYTTSSDATFKADADRFVAWRDKAWRYCYDLLDEVFSGAYEELPSVESVVEGMPQLEQASTSE